VGMKGSAGIEESLGLTECIVGRQAHDLVSGGYPWRAIWERASQTVARSGVAGPSTGIPVTFSAGNSFMRRIGGWSLVHAVILTPGARPAEPTRALGRRSESSTVRSRVVHGELLAAQSIPLGCPEDAPRPLSF